MIDILMATYNGEKYLREQLDSIINQDYTDWQLIIRDDCSTDSTPNILKKYHGAYPDKIKIIYADSPSGSAMNNFFSLLDYAVSDYVMFADQDDVWDRDKISITMQKMKEMERQYGSDVPLLVHTDLCCVDEDLQIINESFMKWYHYDFRKNQLQDLLVQNIVTGCTTLFNRNLLLLFRRPEKACMHDAWIALVASAFGKIGFVPCKTILYRRHESNAGNPTPVTIWKRIRKLIYHLFCKKERFRVRLQLCEWAEEFFGIYGDVLDDYQRSMVHDFADLYSYGFMKRFIVLYKYGFLGKNILKCLFWSFG